MKKYTLFIWISAYVQISAHPECWKKLKSAHSRISTHRQTLSTPPPKRPPHLPPNAFHTSPKKHFLY